MANTIPLAPTMPWWHGPAGGVTTLPLGDTILTDTLYIDNQFGPVLQGQGQFLSGIRWQGPPDRPVIVIRNCTKADVGNFYIRFDTPAKDAIVISNMPTCPPGTVTTSKCKIHDLWIEAGTSGGHYIGDGVRVDSGYFGGPDQNNEYHTVKRCRISGFTNAGVGIYSSQSHRCVISDCEFTQSGDQVGTGVYARFGSQEMIRCKGANLELVFYGVDQFAGVGTVVGNNFEGCKRFVAVGTAGNQWVIENNRCDGMSPYDCSDGDYNHSAVNADASGYLSFKNNFLASQTNIPLRLLFSRNQGLNFIGNRFNAGNAGQPHIVPIYTTTGVVFNDYQWFGNTWQDSAGNHTIPHP